MSSLLPIERLSPPVQKALDAAGWHEGRHGFAGPEVLALRQAGFPVNSRAEQIFDEFGGLSLFDEMEQAWKFGCQVMLPLYRVSFSGEGILNANIGPTVALYAVGYTLGRIVCPAAALYGGFDVTMYVGSSDECWSYNAAMGILVRFGTLEDCLNHLFGDRSVESTSIPLVIADDEWVWPSEVLSEFGLGTAEDQG